MVQTTEDEFHEDLWWLGFDTRHPGDLVRNNRYDEGRRGDVYRGQSFVYTNCIELARKLKTLIGDGGTGHTPAREPLGLPSPTECHGG